jgi:hypothetical protein
MYVYVSLKCQIPVDIHTYTLIGTYRVHIYDIFHVQHAPLLAHRATIPLVKKLRLEKGCKSWMGHETTSRWKFLLQACIQGVN